MSTGSGGKPPRGSQPGRPAADTPNRIVVRSLDPTSDSAIMGSDTAVAVAVKSSLDTSLSGEARIGSAPTPSSGSGQVTELIGMTLSERYLVTRQVGQGGMGAVYEATHTLINKRVAIKVLLEKYAQREAIVRRLKQEAQLASSVGNEHIIDITDFGTTNDGRTFVVMEFLDGESLAECLSREGQLPEQRILRIVAQAANALAAAHAKGVIHRDIKPENLFLLKRKDMDFVKVVDFGISKSLRASSEEEEVTRLTQTGMVLGTPLYMSPEQARGDDEVDHRVDVYALGVIMYEAATGRVPFIGNNYLSVISQVLNEEPKSPRELRPEISEEFEAVVMKAMAKDVTERYVDATEMLADITALLDDPTRSTERAKITGPRRKVLKQGGGSSARYVVWAAGIAVLIAAVVVTVTQVLGSSAKTEDGAGSAALVVPVPVDAMVVAPPIDAPPPPKVTTIKVTIESKPAGATVFLDGLEQPGVTPLEAEVVEKDKDIKLVGQLEGFVEYQLQFNPLTTRPSKDGTRRVRFNLSKAAKNAPKFQRPPKPAETGAGSATKPRDKTGGDFGGNPYGPGGTVNKK